MLESRLLPNIGETVLLTRPPLSESSAGCFYADAKVLSMSDLESPMPNERHEDFIGRLYSVSKGECQIGYEKTDEVVSYAYCPVSVQ